METRLQWKKRILRWLYRQGRRYEEFVDLFRFMDLVMTLPPDLEQECEEAMAKYEEERKMPVLSHFERRAIEKGLQQGIVQATREGVLEVLHLRFIEPPPTLREQIQRLDDLAALKGLHRKAVTAGSLEEFEQEMLTVARE
jgi:hypothetical protein